MCRDGKGSPKEGSGNFAQLLIIEHQRGKQTGTFFRSLDILGGFGLDTERGLLLNSVTESPQNLGRMEGC